MATVTPKLDNLLTVRRYIQRLSSRFAEDKSPTFTGLTLTGLTASSLIAADADKVFESVTIGDSLTYSSSTLDTIQDIRTSASPTFAGLTIVNAITEFSTDGTLGGNSDSALPTEAAVKTYVDAGIGAGGHDHDTDTLQLDGINSDGGAFSFTTTGDITFNQSLILADGKAIGQVDGPLITFDDTNNSLQITGPAPYVGTSLKIGIGTSK